MRSKAADRTHPGAAAQAFYRRAVQPDPNPSPIASAISKDHLPRSGRRPCAALPEALPNPKPTQGALEVSSVPRKVP
jgi:hypothetical protein